MGIEDQPSGACISGERERRILNDGYVKAILPKDIVYTSPTRAVDEATVDKHDV